MQQNLTNFFEWTQKYSTQEACLEELSRCLWKDGLIFSKCSHNKSYQLSNRQLHECAKCGRQVSPTAGTVLEHTLFPLPKWFAAICLMGAVKVGIPAQRLSKMIGVSWPTDYRMFGILRQCMGDRNGGYSIEGLAEVYDVLVGGRKPGKSGRRTEGKKSKTFAVQHRENCMGYYMAALFVERVNSEKVREFVFCFNRRFWEPLLPDRLLQATVDHVPIRASYNSV